MKNLKTKTSKFDLHSIDLIHNKKVVRNDNKQRTEQNRTEETLIWQKITMVWVKGQNDYFFFIQIRERVQVLSLCVKYKKERESKLIIKVCLEVFRKCALPFNPLYDFRVKT